MPLTPEEKREASSELEARRLALVSQADEWFGKLPALVRGSLVCAVQDSRTVSLVWATGADDEDIAAAIRAIADSVRDTDEGRFFELVQSSAPITEIVPVASQQDKPRGIRLQILGVVRDMFSHVGG